MMFLAFGFRDFEGHGSMCNNEVGGRPRLYVECRSYCFASIFCEAVGSPLVVNLLSYPFVYDGVLGVPVLVPLVEVELAGRPSVVAMDNGNQGKLV